MTRRKIRLGFIYGGDIIGIRSLFPGNSAGLASTAASYIKSRPWPTSSLDSHCYPSGSPCSVPSQPALPCTTSELLLSCLCATHPFPPPPFMAALHLPHMPTFQVKWTLLQSRRGDRSQSPGSMSEDQGLVWTLQTWDSLQIVALNQGALKINSGAFKNR